MSIQRPHQTAFAASSKARTRDSDPVDLRIASRLRRRRRELALDTRVLDIIIGESQGTVERYEAGQRRLCSAQLFRLSEALDVTFEYFFAEDAGPEAKSDAWEPAEAPPPDPRALAEAERFVQVFRMLPLREIRRRVINLIKTVADSEPW